MIELENYKQLKAEFAEKLRSIEQEQQILLDEFYRKRHDYHEGYRNLSKTEIRTAKGRINSDGRNQKMKIVNSFFKELRLFFAGQKFLFNFFATVGIVEIVHLGFDEIKFARLTQTGKTPKKPRRVTVKLDDIIYYLNNGSLKILNDYRDYEKEKSEDHKRGKEKM